MSQLPNIPEMSEAGQPSMTALKEYHALMAAGHFKPSSSITLSPLAPSATTPQPSTPASRVSTPRPSTQTPSAPPAPPVGMYAPPRSTPTPPACTTSPYASGWTMPRMAPTHHQPNLAPAYHQPNRMGHQTYGPFPGALQLPQPPLYTPESLTRNMISARIQQLLHGKLYEFSAPALVMLSTQLTNRVIHLGVNGHLGPNGLSGVNDIFMVIGHEGKGVYMSLAVMAPTALRILLRSQVAEFEGKDPMKDAGVMEWLRKNFFNVALDEWQRLGAATGNRGR